MLRSNLDDATEFYPPHGRFYLVQSRDGAIGVGALKRLAVEVGEIQRMYVHRALAAWAPVGWQRSACSTMRARWGCAGFDWTA
jgi:hypothetical protein